MFFCFSAKQGTKRFYVDLVVAEDGSSPLMEGDKREDEVETVKASKEEKPDKGTAQFTFIFV